MGSPWRSLVVPTLFVAIAFAILVSLGLWQLQRLKWKEALIAQVSQLVDSEAVKAPPPSTWPGLDLESLEYQPVTATGRYMHEHEAHVFTTLSSPRGPHGGMGYFILTPLVTRDGWLVFVNRGFVPSELKRQATRATGQIETEVTATGLLRAPWHGSWLSPDDDLEGNVWFTRDPARFAEWQGLSNTDLAPYLIDAHFVPGLPGGLPQGGETYLSFPNNHLGYAVTWFGLAAALVVVFFLFVRNRLRANN